MADNVTPISSAISHGTVPANELNQQVITALERLLTLAKSGELVGMIGILQLTDGSIGNVSAGGGACHPYTTLGALEAITQHHKLAIMQHVELRPVFEDVPDAPKQS